MRYFWINPTTDVKEHTIHGLGRYATSDIKKDEIIFVAGGIAKDTTKEKWYKGLMIDRNLILDLPEGSEYEAYVNHSCDPNCYIDGQVVFRALRDVSKGEFFTIDYGTFMLTTSDPIASCNCGFDKCRGRITGEDYKFLKLPLSWYAQKRLKDEDCNNR
jgi:SET domain-containing protein